MLSAPSTRIALGSLLIAGQRFELFLSPEWGRYFESLTSTVISLSGSSDQAALLTTMMGDSSGEFDDFPGPPGPVGPAGDTGPALFMLQDTPAEQDMPIRPGADLASPPAIGVTVPAPGTFTTLAATGNFGCNGKAPQGPAVSGGTLAGVIAALVANGILLS